MHEEKPIPSALYHPPGWHIGDPFVVLEFLLEQVEGEQQKQLTTSYLDSIAATLQANLKFIQAARSVVASGGAGS